MLDMKYTKEEKYWRFLTLKNDDGRTEKTINNKFVYAIAELSNLRPKILR
tara:strand:- start:306 stop:455 length:150 start_codon:yes stop_codon:yes gene_type:complete